jgi:predicted DNA-binding transcriptional regulator
MHDVSSILNSLGLQKSETKTYLAALQLGPSTVIAISKLVSLSRQATYLAIESLTQRGLMTSVQRGKKRYYAAEPPAKLLAYAKRHELQMRERISDLERSIPELELQAGGEKPVVKVFEGKEGIKAILEDVQEAKSKEWHEFTDNKAMNQVLSDEDLESLRKHIARTNMKGHFIYTKGAENTANHNHNILPAELGNFKANIGVYGNKLALVTFEGKMYSVLVESKALTQAMRTLIDLAIKGLKK